MVKKCALCGTTRQLQQHHISYDPEIIITVCRECHRKLHKHGVGRGTDKYSISLEDFQKEVEIQKLGENSISISPIRTEDGLSLIHI